MPKTGNAGHNSIAIVAEFLEQTEEFLMLLDRGPARQMIPLTL
jgi:hypothetical protein